MINKTTPLAKPKKMPKNLSKKTLTVKKDELRRNLLTEKIKNFDMINIVTQPIIRKEYCEKLLKS